jgi:hypothetical protein
LLAGGEFGFIVHGEALLMHVILYRAVGLSSVLCWFHASEGSGVWQ